MTFAILGNLLLQKWGISPATLSYFILQQTERFVINEVIINDKKEQTVADELHITRQAVNKIKKRALNKIRKILEE